MIFIIKDRSGFSLISVLIAIGLMGFLSLLIMRQQDLMVKIKKSNDTNLEIVKYEYRLERIFGEARLCSQMVNGVDLGSYIVGTPPANGNLIVALARTDTLSYSPENSRTEIELAFIGKELDRGAVISDIFFSYDSEDPGSFINLNIEFDKRTYDQNGNVVGRSLGSQTKLVSLALGYKIQEGTTDIICKFNDELIDERAFCDPDSGTFFTGFDENGTAVCRSVNQENLEGLDLSFDLEGFEGGVSKTTNTAKNATVECPRNSVTAGFKYKRTGGLGGIGKKEKYSLSCAQGLKIRKEKEVDGVIVPHEYDYAGFYEGKEFETKVPKETWGNCPEGQVVAKMDIKKNRDMELLCRNLVFESDSELHCDPNEIAGIKREKAFFAGEIEKFRTQLLELEMAYENTPKDDEYALKRDTINGQIAQYQSQLGQLEEKRGSCHARYISNKESKSTIIRTTASTSGAKECPPGYFLTGAIIEKKENYKIRCSKLSALKEKN